MYAGGATKWGHADSKLLGFTFLLFTETELYENVVSSTMVMPKLPLVLLAALLLLPVGAAPPPPPRSVMIWVANPNNETRLGEMIQDLKAHRAGFTGLAYQYFGICGHGSNDAGGSKDCTPEDARGMPHLAQAHPTGVPRDIGARLRKELGPDLELWPVVSYGNPGNASVLNALLTNETVTEQFIADAIKVAHEQNLTGFNFDLEADATVPWSNHVSGFLKNFTAAMHAAEPRIGVSYDGGSSPEGTADVDRWISMGTYTSDLTDFKRGLATGIATCGPGKFGVGLCPSCGLLPEADVQARFDGIEYFGASDMVYEIDLWAYGATGWDFYWPRLEKWLDGRTEG